MLLFPWQRARAQLVMLGALAVILAVVAATFVASAGFVERRSGEIAAAELGRASGSTGALVLQTRLGEDQQAQQDAWAGLLAEAAPGEALDVARLLITEPLTLALDDAEPGGDEATDDAEAPDDAPTSAASRTSLAVVDWLPEHADLTAGAWPKDAPAPDGGRLPAVVPLASAQELGVDVGDVLELGLQRDVVVEIVGTWEPRDPAAPRWVGFGSVDLSGSAAAFGPVVVADLAAVVDDPYVRWSIIPAESGGAPDDLSGGARLDLADAQAAATGVGALAAAVADDEAVAPRGVTSTGDLAVTLDGLVAGARAAALVGNVALVLLAVIGVATVSQVARLVATTRAGETAILIARGASTGWLAALTWGEAVVVALVGTAGGVAVGVLLGGALTPALLPLALVILVVGTAAIALPGWALNRSIGRGARPDPSGRARTLATGGAAVLLLLAAGLSLWRFTRPTDAPTAVDAVVSIGAPGLVVLALAVVALVLLAPVWSGLERAAAAMRRTAPRLALLSVTRRRAVLSVPLLLVVVAVATAVLGSGYTASTLAAQRQLDDTRVGADARLVLPTRSAVSAQFPPREADAVRALEGVEAAALVSRLPARAGQQDLVLEAVAADAVAPVVRGGTLPPGDLAAAIAPPPSLPLAPGPVTVTVTAAQAESLYVGEILEVSATGVLWLHGPGGAIARVDLEGGPVPLGGATALPGEIPDGEWDLLAIDVLAVGVVDGWESTLEVTLTEISGASLDDDWATRAWPAVTEGSGAAAAEGAPPGRTALAGLQDVATLRFVPRPVAVVPAVVTRALADRLDLAPGGLLTVGYRGTTVDVEVAAVTDLVPGLLDTPAAVVDLTALQRVESLGRRAVADAGEIWVSAGDAVALPTDTAEALQTLAREEGGTLVTAESEAGTGSAVAQPVFVVVGLVAILLAVVGTLAAFDVLARSRRGEVITLRAVGIPGRTQARGRLLEAVVLALVAVPTGALVGWAVGLLTIGTLVRLSIPGLAALSQPLRLAPLELGLALALAVGGVVAVGAIVAHQVRRQHADTDHREETR